MKYDVYHRKMMFKVISIITKPGKHSKYNEICCFLAEAISISSVGLMPIMNRE